LAALPLHQVDSGCHRRRSRPNKPVVKQAITLAEAVSSFRADEDGRCLEKTTIAQSRSLFEVQLLS